MKNDLPLDEELLSQKAVLQASIDEALQSPRKTLKITVRDKLRLLNDELIRFKDTGISYRIIRRLLREKLGLKVSEQTLREHCQQELGFVKRSSQKAKALSEKSAWKKTKNRPKGILAKTPTELTNDSNPEKPHSPRSAQSSTDFSERSSKPQTAQATQINSQIKQASVSEQITQHTESMLNKLEDY